MPFLRDMVQLGKDKGIVTDTTVGWSTKTVIPETISPLGTYTVLISTGGTGNLGVHNSDGYERPAFQLRVHANTYDLAEAQAYRWFREFGKVKNQFLGNTYYQKLTALQQPFDGGLDAKQRPTVAFNVLAVKRPDA